MIRCTPVFLMAAMAVLWIYTCDAARAADAEKPSDGEWAVKLKPAAGNKVKGSTQEIADTLIIRNGKFNTAVNAKYGFEDAPCTVKTTGGKTILTAQLVNEKHGKIVFELELAGGKVSGKMVWGKMSENGKPINAEFAVTGDVKK